MLNALRVITSVPVELELRSDRKSEQIISGESMK